MLAEVTYQHQQETWPEPEVSVVVIVYNDADRLPRAVRSVLSQSLRNLEVVIVDDCSTDGTPAVIERLRDADSRVRCLRLERNSGGCSAPRNLGVTAAQAPYLMFLDSDDELPKHACKSLLITAERTRADFVTGEVTRIFEESGSRGLWYPALFDAVRLIHGVREAPQYFQDHLATNKLYRKSFITGNELLFPEGIHYEDQLFTAKAFVLARSFAVVPWTVYNWHHSSDPAALSISSSRHKLQNIRDRIAVARLVDTFLLESGNGDLRPAKDQKFLGHDLRLYLGDLPFRSQEWIELFAEVVTPYLSEVSSEAGASLPRELRVCLHLLRSGRIAEACEAARSLGRPKIAPRMVTREAGRLFWGDLVPGPTNAGALDISDWRLDEQPFDGAPIRHEVDALEPSGPVLRLLLRTYDPARLLAGAENVTAELRLSAGREPVRIPFRYAPDPDESDVHTAEIELDLRDVPMRRRGFKGTRHPVIALSRLGAVRTDPVLARNDMMTLRTSLPLNGPLAGHTVRAGCEGRGAGRLAFTWTRSGVLAWAADMAPRLAPVRRKVRRARRRLSGNQSKALVYQELLKLPMDKDLVLFEAVEGRGYTDSPRYIHEELVRRGLPLRVVWSHSGDTSSFPKDVQLVKRGSWAYVRTLARAGYWVDSHGFPSIYTKRRETRYLQTWHGQAIKHMGFDTPQLRFASAERQQQHRAMISRWDVLICPSDEFGRTVVQAHEFAGTQLACGLPRNDVLVRWNEPEQRDRAATARARLSIPVGRKVLLYVPTFRDGSKGESIRVDLAELTEKVGADWRIVVRPHYYERFAVPPELGHIVRDGSKFPDVNDLLLASDALVTDYSSVMFDYANLGRPILLFADDYEEYSSTRGMYYNLADIAPGPLLTTTAELATALHHLDRIREEWADRYARFHRTFNPLETGRASKTVVDMFFEGDAP